jgi:hypothetical protein
MKRFVAISLCVGVFSAATLAGENGYKVRYDGGSVANVKSGNDLRLSFDATKITLMKGKSEAAQISSPSVTEISYGQDVHRRIGAAIGIGVFTLGIGALMALTKSKKHFIGLTWDDGGKKGGAAFQVDKSNYRGVLAGLEGVTGKKAVNSDTMTVKN